MSFAIQRALYPYVARDETGAQITDKTITVSTVAVAVSTSASFTAMPAVGGADLVTFDVSVSDVRCRFDGGTPTSSTGHLLPATTAYTWSADMWNRAIFIRDTTMTVDAVIWASACNL